MLERWLLLLMKDRAATATVHGRVGRKRGEAERVAIGIHGAHELLAAEVGVEAVVRGAAHGTGRRRPREQGRGKRERERQAESSPHARPSSPEFAMAARTGGH